MPKHVRIAAALLAITVSVALAWPASAEDAPPEVDLMELAETPIAQHDFEKGTKDGAPNDPNKLPSYIKPLNVTLSNGKQPQRADWSPDGNRLIFLDAPIGDVWEYDLATADAEPVTTSGNVLRAHHLSNGDLLLCLSASGTSRFDGQLHVLRHSLGETLPVALQEGCWEGIAVSKDSLRIAWNRSSIDFTQIPQVFVEAAVGQSEVMVGRIDYSTGVPRLLEKVKVVDKRDVGPDATVEAQDFFDGDRKLVFSAYAHQGGQVMSIDLETRRITDESRSPWYEEPEGIDPGGEFVLVERDLSIMVFPGELDIWQLELGGEGGFRRLTTFNHYKGYGATNPVVSPDGKRIAFQMEKAGSEHGEGHGLFLFDLETWSENAPPYEPDPFRTPQRP